MTIKTLLIAIGLILGFAGLMSLAWTASEWMMGAPVAEVEPTQPKAPAAEKTETTVPAPSEAARTEPVQDTKVDQEPPVQSGAYDDNWTGRQEPDADVGLAVPSQVQPKSLAPVTETPEVDPARIDDRETSAETEQPASSLPSAQNPDPYKGDDREN